MCIRRDRRAGLYSRRVPQPLLQVRRVNRFDAAHAKCFLVEDQERLLAIVEAGFGSLAPFSALIRGIFRDARATHLEVKIDKLQASNDELHAKLDRLLSAK